MDRPSIQQLIEERYDDLPSVVRNVIDSEEIGSAIVEIANKNNLKEEQSDLFADEIGYVLFGLTPLSKFKQILQETVGLPPSRALSVSSEVYGTVFQQVKKFLKDSDDEVGTVRQSIDGISYRKPIQTSPASMSVPVKSAATTTVNDIASNNPDASPSSPSIYQDEESLSHHDILSEIENPTASIIKPSSSSAENPVYSDYNAYKNPTLDIELQSDEVTGDVQERNIITQQPVFIPGSVHHDAGINMNSFKPIENTEITEGTAADQNPSQIILDKLTQKLDSPVSHPQSEVIVPKPKGGMADPYREPIE